jgi:hypothetical protein
MQLVSENAARWDGFRAVSGPLTSETSESVALIATEEDYCGTFSYSRNQERPSAACAWFGGNRGLLSHDASSVLSTSTLRSHTVPGPSTTTLSLMRSGF